VIPKGDREGFSCKCKC